MTNQDIKRAIFSDTTEEFVNPSEVNIGDLVTIRIRVPYKSVREVLLLSSGQKIKMSINPKLKNKNGFSYYETTHVMTADTFIYCFEIELDDEKIIYDARGVVDEVADCFSFHIIPGFRTPEWAKGAVFYQIYVDRFCNGDKKNDVLSGEYKYIDRLSVHKEWDEDIETGLTEHYGGDLQGIIDKLDYLKELGVDVIYLNPVFVSPSNHKYDAADYDNIDPHFGVIIEDEGELLADDTKENTEATRFISRVTSKKNLEASNALFAKLVSEAHSRDMKVILDGVFNHCGSFNKWMDRERIYENAEGFEKGAYITEDSPYNKYFSFSEDNWPYNNKYDSWWGYETLPKLNYECTELYEYILKIGAKWVSEPYNADGWRLDVAADLGPNEELNHNFWRDFRESVKNANPEAIILAEHYGDPSAWLEGDQWDTVMNYDAFMEPISWFLTGMEKHNDDFREDLLNNQIQFWESMKVCGAKFNNSSLQVAMNELSNHDHSRFLTRTTYTVGRMEKLGKDAASDGINKAVFREAVVMQMTWPGAPTLYYGDEAGVTGFTDPDNRRVYPWGNEDKELIEFHREIIKVHKEHDELSTGSLIALPTPIGSLAYGRKKADNVSIVIVNNMPVAMEYKLPVWMLGAGKNRRYKTIFRTDEYGFATKGKSFKDTAGILTIVVPANGSVVLNRSKNKKKKMQSDK